MVTGVRTSRHRHILGNSRAWPIALTAVLCLVASVSVARADTIEFSTATSPFTAGVLNEGWWTAQPPGATDANPTYSTGFFGFTEFRGFFTFDLSGLDPTTQAVTGATLVVDGGRYLGASAVERLALSDVDTPAATLNHNTGISAPIFNDLGTGTLFGVVDVPRYADFASLTFELNAAASADIMRHAGTFFSIGGRLLSDPADLGSNLIFADTGSPARLIVRTTNSQTPEPASLVLVSAGALFLRGTRMRRQRHA